MVTGGQRPGAAADRQGQHPLAHGALLVQPVLQDLGQDREPGMTSQQAHQRTDAGQEGGDGAGEGTGRHAAGVYGRLPTGR